MLQRDLPNSANRLFARAAHYSRIDTAALTDPGPEGTPRAVLFAESAEFCKYLFSLPRRGDSRRQPGLPLRNGALLTATAMMAGAWNGFLKSNWNVRWESLRPLV